MSSILGAARKVRTLNFRNFDLTNVYFFLICSTHVRCV